MKGNFIPVLGVVNVEGLKIEEIRTEVSVFNEGSGQARDIVRLEDIVFVSNNSGKEVEVRKIGQVDRGINGLVNTGKDGVRQRRRIKAGQGITSDINIFSNVMNIYYFKRKSMEYRRIPLILFRNTNLPLV